MDQRNDSLAFRCDCFVRRRRRRQSQRAETHTQTRRCAAARGQVQIRQRRPNQLGFEQVAIDIESKAAAASQVSGRSHCVVGSFLRRTRSESKPSAVGQVVDRQSKQIKHAPRAQPKCGRRRRSAARNYLSREAPLKAPPPLRSRLARAPGATWRRRPPPKSDATVGRRLACACRSPVRRAHDDANDETLVPPLSASCARRLRLRLETGADLCFGVGSGFEWLVRVTLVRAQVHNHLRNKQAL